MKLIVERLRRARQREEGFTLIELLIVILVLGILAGIAVFASGPFRDRAESACGEANAQIGLIADAAVDAGVTGDLYADPPSGCVGGPGGGPVAFAATFVDSYDAGVNTLDPATTTADNLLVAVVGHRTTPLPLPSSGDSSSCPGSVCGAADVATPTAAGTGTWTYQGHAFYQTSGSDRRGIAVFTKVAVGGGDDDIAVTWPGTTMDIMMSEFSRDTGTWANTATFAATEPGTTSPFVLAPATGSAGSALLITGVVGRGGPNTGTPGFGMGIVDGNADGGSADLGLYTGYDSLADAAGGSGATFTFSSSDMSPTNGISGFALLVK